LEISSIHLRGLEILFLDRLVNLSAVDGNLVRGLNSQPNFVATDVHHRDHDVVPNHDALVALPG
jgi:hypothetical protein